MSCRNGNRYAGGLRRIDGVKIRDFQVAMGGGVWLAVGSFATLEQARAWAATFVHWYNHDHAHSGIRYVSPAHRHAGEDVAILAARHVLYQEAKAQHPRRWSGANRNWSPITVVTLNPEREAVVNAALDPLTEKRKSA